MATTIAPTSFPFSGATYFPNTSGTTVPPNTVAPTTLVPTTWSSGITYWPGTTMVPTSVSPTTAPPFDPKPWLNKTFWPNPISIAITLEGTQFNIALAMAPIEIELTLPIIVGGHPQIVLGLAILGSVGGYIKIAISPTFSYITIEAMRANWVKWSKIGFLDFTIDQSNVAGERSVDWKGWVYAIKKLGNRVIVYGQNGVSIFKASDVYYGMETIYRIGLAGKGAVAGDDSVHFFVDTYGRLFRLDDKLVKLDYSEFLSLMNEPVLSYDKVNDLLYICDGIVGYVYGVKTGSLGQGPVNITGIDSQSGDTYVVSPSAIVTPKFEICTDIYDFGSRKLKTIDIIEVGSNLTDDLHASVDYRVSYRDNFTQIGWFLVNPDGKAFPKCYGVEFRFRLKSFIREYFELDYLRIKGNIHGFSPLDTKSDPLQALAQSRG